jgi:hypothetical protein
VGRLTLPSSGGRGRPRRTDVAFRDRRRRGLRDLGRWPFRVGICATLAVLTGLAAIAQREALAPPRWGVVVLVVVAVLPWLVDLLVAVPPPWAFAGAVVLPVALLHDPVGFDPLPLLLAILALDLGLQAGPRRSFVVLVPGLVVALGPAMATVGLTRALVAVLAAVGGGWLVGLALHSQVDRVARLRARLRHVEAELAQARAELMQARRQVSSDVEVDDDAHRAH